MSKKILSLIFSKDRPMQLQATIDSFLYHCDNNYLVDIVVYYKATLEMTQKQYKEMANFYKNINFVKEKNFKQDIINIISGYNYILMQVDDNIWIRTFDMQRILNIINIYKDVIGFSFRLSPSLKFHYLTGKKIQIPSYTKINNFIKYKWIGGGHDFGYPLEVSATLYRTSDILDIIRKNNFKNPNSFEG
ncbi:MAG: hypothetical protein ACOCP8_08280, partial [archaeon]